MKERHIPDRSREWRFRFGTIPVRRGFVTKEQVREALVERIDDDLNEKPYRMIGEIIFEKDWITGDLMNLVLKKLF